MGSAISEIGRGGKNLVYFAALLDPFQIDQLARKVLRGVSFDLKGRVRNEISVRAPAATSRTKRLWLNRRVIENIAAGGEECAGVIRKPECAEDLRHRLSLSP